MWRMLISFFFLSGFFFVALSSASEESRSQQNVLVLHSFHKGQRWTDSIADGIESVLGNSDNNIQLYFDYMDAEKIFDSQHLKNLHVLYQHKFKNRKFDAVITSDDQAFNFILNRHYSLFLGTPVIFCGVKYFEDYTLYGKQHFTGVVEAIDIKATLDVALEINPKVKKVFVIVDKTPSSIATIQTFVGIMPAYQGKLTFNFIEDLHMQDLLLRVEKLSRDTIIILVSFNVDKSGQAYSLKESTRLISQHSPVPVYSFWDSYLGYGILGGMLVSGFSQGEEAAKMAIQVLDGEKIDEIPVVKKSPNKHMFDFEQLRRFNINPDILPPGSILVNHPHTFYTEYKKMIWMISSSILGLILIVFLLTINILKRKKAELSLQRYFKRLQILHKTDRAILEARSTVRIAHDVLKYVRGLFACQRVSVVLFDYQTKEAFVLAVNVSDSTQIEEGAVFPLEAFGTRALRKGEIIRVDDLHDLRQPTIVDHALRAEKIRAYVRIPLISHDKLIGSLNLSSETPSVFENEKIDIVCEVATSLALAIQNMRLVSELMAHEKDLKRMSDMIIKSQEETRKKISIELHDEMGQALTAINLNLSVIEKDMPDDFPLSVSERLSETKIYIERLSDQIRDLSYFLWPPMLSDLGLVAALRSHINGFAECSNLNIALESETYDKRLPTEMEIVLYRIVQEALNNVVKHAQADNVFVKVSCWDDKVAVNIKDDGTGFIQIKNDRFGHNAGDGLGLLGMRERLSTVGGNFAITSSLGAGTSVTAEIPLPEDEKHD